MTNVPITFAGICVAALGGAAIGVERQRSGHATGENARLGGVRTFTLLGDVSGLAGWLAAAGLISVAVVLVATGHVRHRGFFLRRERDRAVDDGVVEVSIPRQLAVTGPATGACREYAW